MNEIIKITQLPVIEEQLRSMQEQVEKRTGEAMGLVCTEATVQAVKKIRAALNGEFWELEAQRRAVKKAILEPYDRFEALYARCISGPYKRADADLKGKIDAVQGEIRARKETELAEFYNEYAAAHGVDWLHFCDAGIKVPLSSSMKKLQDEARAIIDRIESDTAAIEGMESADEIMAEYKACRSLADAVTIVKERHERIAAQQRAAEERKAAQEAQRAAVERVEAAAPVVMAPPVQAPQEQEKEYTCTFKVRATLPKLKALKAYMDKEEISYE